MTLAEFRTLVKAFAQVEGQPYLTEDADVDALINEKLREFARRTRCLFTSQATFAIQAGVATYNMEGTTNPVNTSGTIEFCEITNVVLNSLALYDRWGRIGKTTYEDLIDETPNFTQTTAGTPIRWTQLPSQQLILWPSPSTSFVSASSGENFVSGFYLPTSLVDDADELEFVDDTQRVAAKYVAAELIHPYAAGASLAKYDRLMKEVSVRINELRVRYDDMSFPPNIRAFSNEGSRRKSLR